MIHGLLPALTAIAVAYLLLAYALGGPVMLVRTLLSTITRRRIRYRGVADDVLASSRFTIPVSVILPTGGEDVGPAAERLLELNYPELEVIVVNDGTAAALTALRDRFALSAYEVFYRRTLPTQPVRGLFRSGKDPRLLIVDTVPGSRGDALNCGANLARFRYVCCADRDARYHADALLDTMRAALENPARIVGITTTLTPRAAEDEGREERDDRQRPGVLVTLQRLGTLRALLARNAQRRLGLALDAHPGFTIWRRDVIVEAGGFATDGSDEHIDMTFRAHRHLLRAGESYAILNVAEPVGVAGDPAPADRASARAPSPSGLAATLWRYRGMLLNPRYGRVGLVNLPWYVFALIVVPWLELGSLAMVPIAAVAGVLSVRNALLVLTAVALGNGILLNTAMLLTPPPPTESAVLERLLVAPLEVFLWRPVRMMRRVISLVRVIAGRPGSMPA